MSATPFWVTKSIKKVETSFPCLNYNFLVHLSLNVILIESINLIS
ncbi:hypothetical protein K5E_00760 [Enterococcus thailandicus]|uniref:Uncharacterized protein n=1 Tax=Enterococcus thailandicus TaxID=417368 RepID=A0A510WA72_ENTTH|nr:hypothetical protein ETH01_04050 [Enterococcus thailandicus]GMC00104.1 hypothetical protein K2F_03630 [Enterococcus thailandicus]GMC04381.1 hypothetical protein K4E_19280 [Enterococcus thailandicus]GMC07938.1 hypothetical protein K5E_00760 [Enterococcus thailandicus]